MNKNKDDIKNFYNKVAEKYYLSRQKHWSDWKVILEELKKTKKKNISILEFWCGWWRLITYLNENLKWINIKYIWVDISKNLLTFAKKDNPKDKFICDDISKFIVSTKQESFDYIIWIASFQHIDNEKERKFLMKNFYRSLTYGWKLIMLNWSFSNRFIKKYFKPILKALRKSIYSIWYYNLRDLYIPWGNNKKIYNRFYHIFSPKELNQLWRESWFDVNILTYLDKVWQKTDNRKHSKNSLFVWEKKVFLD